MVIQRIQTLLLLIAAIIMTADIAWVPICVPGADAAMHASDFTPVLILGIVAGAMMLIDIFLFKNLKLQITVASIAALLVVAYMAVGSFMLVRLTPEGAGMAWVWCALTAVVSLILVIRARSCMKQDRKLLRAADRLR